jgi:hypothetical protein
VKTTMQRGAGPGRPARPLGEDLHDVGRAFVVVAAGALTLTLAATVLVPTPGATRSAKLDATTRQAAIERAVAAGAVAGGH